MLRDSSANFFTNSPPVTVDDFCKDSLEIVDVDNRRTLYRGCSELSRPIRVQSFSSNVEVSSKESLI